MIKVRIIAKKLAQRENIILFLIFIVALGVRLYMASHNRVMRYDGTVYCQDAIAICDGRFADAFTHDQPLYPAIISFFHLFLSDIEFCGKLVSVIFGTLLVGIIYLLAKKLFNRKVALMSAVLVTFYPTYVWWSAEVMTESLYIFLRTIAILTGLIALKTDKKVYFITTGVIIGLSYLTRAIGLLDFITMLILTLLFMVVKHKRIQKKTILSCLMLIIGFLPFFAPYITYLHTTQGVWKLSAAGGEQRIKCNETRYDEDKHCRIELSPDARTFKREPKIGVLTYIRNNFRSLPRIYLKIINMMYRDFIPQILPIFIVILGAIGLVQNCGYKANSSCPQDSSKNLYILGWIVIPLLVFGFLAPLSRYLTPFFPPVLIWASKGIEGLSQWLMETLHLKKTSIKKIFIYIISIILLLSFIQFYRYPIIAGKFWEPYECKLAGLWLKEHTNPDCKVMTSFSVITFYGERTWINLPNTDCEKLLKFIYYNSIDYIAIEEDYIRRSPQLAFLIDETKAPEELKPVYIFDEVEGHKLIIYEVLLDKEDNEQ